MQAKLTDAVAAKAGAGVYFDGDKRSPRGFLLRVTPAGARAWCLNYRVRDTGRERRLTIGDVASWPIAAARERAAELRREIDTGGDPLGQREEKRAAPTVNELVDRFIAKELPSRAPRTQVEYRSMLQNQIVPALGRMKVAAVVRNDIEKLCRRITASGIPRRANATKSVCSILFNQAIEWGMRADNPAQGVKTNPEHGRERYLKNEEIERLMSVLDRWHAKRPDSVDIIRLAMLTGARRGEIMSMRWPDIDLAAAIWVKPAMMTKQRKAHRVPLAPEAVDLLRRRQSERQADTRIVRLRDDHVFRGGGDGAHVTRLRDAWEIIRAEAQLSDVHFHDLRHSFASLLVSQGLSALLGHAKPATTNRYAHLADKPLREAAAIVGKIVGGKGEK
ncbi:MAG: tyrosine-type recombinase/integrase [Stellaceae bacterium]